MRIVGRVLGAALSGICMVSGGLAASDDTSPIAQALDLDYQGCHLSARAAFETILAGNARTLSPRDLIDVQKMLLASCIDSIDVECMLQHLPTYQASVTTLSGSDEDMQWLALYWAILKLRVGDSQPPTSQDLFRLVATNASPLQPALYIESQLWQSESLIERGDVEGSRVAAERALSLLLTLRQPFRYDAWRWLIRICGLLTRAGDVVRANKLLVASAPLWGSEGNNGIATRDTFELVGRLSERLGEFQRARFCFEEAIRLTDSQELPEAVKANIRDWYLTELASTCMVSLDIPCARNALERSSRANRLAAGTLKEKDLTESDLAYMAALCLLDSMEDQPLRRDWLSTFEALQLRSTNTESLLARLNRESLAAAAAGLIRFEAKDPGAECDIETFILKRLELEHLESQLLPDATTLPSAMDRVYLRFALRALRSLSMIDHATAVDLSLRVAQAANRSLSDAEGDALALKANLPTEYDRRNGHALLRLNARQSVEEGSLLRGLVAALVKGEFPPGDSRFKIYDYSARARLANLGERRELLRREVVRASSQSMVVSRNVSLAEIQSVLRPGEAVVVISEDLGNAVHVAVTRDDSLIVLTPVDWGQVSRDIHLLSLALTADRPASDLLDASYPVNEATRLYRVLLGPVEKFLQRSTHLIWIPPQEIFSVPLNALLRSAPPKRGDGFELSQADFVVKRFEISLSTSVKAFVASRKSPAYGHNSFSFFGVGDPMLSGRTADGVDRRSAASRGGRNLAADKLSSLPDLPETGDELREIGKSFGERATILTKLAATEASVRRRLLSDYSVIEFATHGLVKEDLKGLTESALVLTPQFSDRSEDDGLLTASEIADLDLNARLAVLSACNTAQSDASLLSAEVHGLTNAFALAGVPASLVTLWPVNSEVARRIVADTLSRLNRQQIGPTSALTQSMRSFLNAPGRAAHLHPRFWAPFAIVGDGGDTEKPRVDSAGQWRRLAYRVLDDRPDGSIVNALSLSGRRFLTAAVYGKDKTSAGVIELFSASGATVWRRDYPGWSPIRLAARSDTTAALGLELRGDHVTAVVRAFDASGRELWQRDIDGHYGECLPIALTSEPDGTWRLLLSTASGQPGAASQRSFMTATLNSSGDVIEKAETPLDGGKGALPGAAIRRQSAWLLAFRGWTVNSQLKSLKTAYGESEDCREIPMTTIGEISDTDPRWRQIHVFENSMNAMNIVPLAGRLAFAGSTMNRCQSLQFASIKFLSADGKESSGALDPQPLGSRLVRLFQGRSDGTLLAVGLSERIGDPGGQARQATVPEILGRPAPDLLPGEPWEDVVLMEIDERGRFSPKMWLQSGMSIGLEDAALGDDELLCLVGSIGSKGFVASYEWIAGGSK